MSLLKLYIVFFNIGLFTIGGGLASLPLLKEAVVDSGMISNAEFVDMIAISQATPGPIGINMATFAGYKLSVISGACIATLGIISPSLIIILLIAISMKNFSNNPVVKGILWGIRPAAVGMIAAAAWFICGQSFFTGAGNLFQQLSIPSALLAGLLALAYWRKPASPVIYIFAGGLLGLIFF
ncbi:MAG: chromate transporter [Kiritimatiellales bacterium]